MQPPQKSNLRLFALIVMSVLATAALAATVSEKFLTGQNDFFALFPGGKLSGTPKLYDIDTELAVQTAEAHGSSRSMYFNRLPFNALILWPICRLPYLQAYWLYQALSLSAYILFMSLWRPPDTRSVVESSLLFLPALEAWVNGQDILFLLPTIALALRLRDKQPMLCGALLTLLSIKVHLIMLLPVAMIAGRFWKITLGYALGALALIAVCFAAQGPSWPFEFYALISHAPLNPHVEFMPNLHNLFQNFPLSAWWQGIFTIAIVIATWLAARRQNFVNGFNLALCGGILIGYHGYLHDCSLLLPGLLTARATSEWPLLRKVSEFMLMPFVYVLLFMPTPVAVFPALLLAYFGLLAYEPWWVALHSGSQEESSELLLPVAKTL